MFGLLAYGLSMFCFVWFIKAGYEEQISKAYMSLDRPDDSICHEKTKTVDDDYLADFTGKWNGEDGFQYSNALYQLNLNRFNETKGQYKKIMKYVGHALDELGSRSFDYDLAENMVYWMAWQIILPYAKSVNTFHMTGSPEVIFDREHIFGLVANINGECLVKRETGYDKANALFRLKYNIPEFSVDPICNTTMLPSEMGYDPVYDFEEFILNIDVRTFIVSFAVRAI